MTLNKPIPVSQRLEKLLTDAVEGFAEGNPKWEAHVGYHDEPLWILQMAEGNEIRRIQMAVFDAPEGPALYIIPDDSGRDPDARKALRLKMKTIALDDLRKREGKEQALLNDIEQVVGSLSN